MAENVSSKKSFYAGKNAGFIAMVFIFVCIICQWSYTYYQNNPLKFPWGSVTYTVDADSLELLPNEQANYLGTRAGEESGTEFLYRANSMHLVAASGFSIRTGPGVYYQSIGRMYYGREVHVLATCEDNDWYLIDFYGEEAYVHSACLFEELPDREEEELTEVSIIGSRSEDEILETGETLEPEAEAAVSEETEPSESVAPAEAVATATPTPTPTIAPTSTPRPTEAPAVSAPADPVMLELFNLVNEERARQGLAPFSWNSQLAADAAVRAQEITVSFSHTRPDGSDWWTVDPDRMYGENLACGQSTAQEVFNSWMASPGHRANILGAYNTCGYALYYNGDAASTYYWAQEFGY